VTFSRIRFAEALEQSLGEKECNVNNPLFVNFNQSFLSPISSPNAFKKTKKGKVRLVACFLVYGLFLSTIIIATVAMAIAMIIAITAKVVYVIKSPEVAWDTGAAVGTGVTALPTDR
jgi:hypothetical protein